MVGRSCRTPRGRAGTSPPKQLLSVAKAICGMDLSLRALVAYRVDDLRDLPLIELKQRLARLIAVRNGKPSISMMSI